MLGTPLGCPAASCCAPPLPSWTTHSHSRDGLLMTLRLAPYCGQAWLRSWAAARWRSAHSQPSRRRCRGCAPPRPTGWPSSPSASRPQTSVRRQCSGFARDRPQGRAGLVRPQRPLCGLHPSCSLSPRSHVHPQRTRAVPEAVACGVACSPRAAAGLACGHVPADRAECMSWGVREAKEAQALGRPAARDPGMAAGASLHALCAARLGTQPRVA